MTFENATFPITDAKHESFLFFNKLRSNAWRNSRWSDCQWWISVRSLQPLFWNIPSMICLQDLLLKTKILLFLCTYLKTGPKTGRVKHEEKREVSIKIEMENHQHKTLNNNCCLWTVILKHAVSLEKLHQTLAHFIPTLEHIELLNFLEHKRYL